METPDTNTKTTMKNIVTAIMTAAFATFATVNAAEETATPITVEGTATCAKCDLDTKDKCQSVLQVTKDGKTETYVLEGKAGGDWHKTICKQAKDVKMTGTVSVKDGEKVFTATEIEMTDKKAPKKDDADKG
jgi:aspartyl-tRNA synthetase